MGNGEREPVIGWVIRIKSLNIPKLILSDWKPWSMGARNSRHARDHEPLKIEKRMVRALVKRGKSGRRAHHKAFNSFILKFPKIDKAFEGVRSVFKKFDKDGNGTIDLEELKDCLKELKVNFTEEEVKAIYEESDIDGSHGIDFKEFIVLLALVYFLGQPAHGTDSRIGLPQLEATFETIVEAFVFFDRDGDGYLSKKEMVYAINESSPGPHSDRVGLRRFEEMDWDKNGTITFKEFLFAFTDWVGLEIDDDDEDDERRTLS